MIYWEMILCYKIEPMHLLYIVLLRYTHGNKRMALYHKIYVKVTYSTMLPRYMKIKIRYTNKITIKTIKHF